MGPFQTQYLTTKGRYVETEDSYLTFYFFLIRMTGSSTFVLIEDWPVVLQQHCVGASGAYIKKRPENRSQWSENATLWGQLRHWWWQRIKRKKKSMYPYITNPLNHWGWETKHMTPVFWRWETKLGYQTQSSVAWTLNYWADEHK